MNNEKLSMNVECDTTGSTPSKSGVLDLTATTGGRESGIYKIVNKINGKYYVGSSNNIVGQNGRWNTHRTALNHNRHYNQHLQRAWNKYGKEHFDFIVVIQTPVEKLLIEEQKYLDIAKLEMKNVYNTSFLAGRVEMTSKLRSQISATLKGRPCPTKGIKQSVSRIQHRISFMMGEKNTSWKKIDVVTKNSLFEEYKINGYMKMQERAKSFGFGYSVVQKLVREFKQQLNIPLTGICMNRFKKNLSKQVKEDLLSMWLENGWSVTGKWAKEKYGIGYKTLSRTIKKFQLDGFVRK